MEKRSILLLIMTTAVILVGCDRCSKGKEGEKADASGAASSPSAESANPAAGVEATAELQTIDITVGSGVEATDGKKVTVNYTGTLMDGTKFDSTKDHGQPFPFTLGSGMVIAGWEQGVRGMKEGGVRKLVIPPHLAYGSRGVGNVIPPNSTLVFEIELLKVE